MRPRYDLTPSSPAMTAMSSALLLPALLLLWTSFMQPAVGAIVTSVPCGNIVNAMAPPDGVGSPVTPNQSDLSFTLDATPSHKFCTVCTDPSNSQYITTRSGHLIIVPTGKGECVRTAVSADPDHTKVICYNTTGGSDYMGDGRIIACAFNAQSPFMCGSHGTYVASRRSWLNQDVCRCDVGWMRDTSDRDSWAVLVNAIEYDAERSVSYNPYDLEDITSTDNFAQYQYASVLPGCNRRISDFCGDRATYGTQGATYQYLTNETVSCACADNQWSGDQCGTCAAGNYVTDAGSGDCVSCPPGTFTTGYGSQECSNCTAGYIANTERTECIQDPCTVDNGGCSTTAGSESTCTVDLSTIEVTCGPCAAGFSGDGYGDCVACDAGTINDGSSTICTPCEAGHHSANTTTCLPCPSGTFAASEGQSDCVACPDNAYSSVPGSAGCSDCAMGFQANGDRTGCDDIDECLVDNGGCSQTPGSVAECVNGPGSYSCGPCAAGFSGDGYEDCVACDAGTVNDGSSTTCTPCPAGSYASNATTCTPCAAGTYAPEQGYAECLPCTDNTFADSAGALTCYACDTGFQSNGDHTGCDDIDECLDNNGGCSQTVGSVAECVNSPGSYSCGSCAAGFSGDGYGDCVACDAGTINNGSSTACTPCPAGSYATNATTCTPCTAGTYAPEEGYSECLPCTGNTFSSNDGALTCYACDAGYQANGEHTGCDDIDECLDNNGGCSQTEGSVAECVNSPGSFACGPCAAGFLGSGYGDCVACDAGKFGGGSSACFDCAAGTYNPDTGSADSTSCLPCANGTHADTLGMSACLQCEPGRYSDAPSAVVCAPCPGATYQPAFGGTQCLSCDAGYTGNATATGCDDINECDSDGACIGDARSCLNTQGGYMCPCNAGYFDADGGATPTDPRCFACPQGSYSGMGFFPNCTSCSPGRYQAIDSDTQDVVCVDCALGRYSPSVADVLDFGACTDCPVGTWSDVVRAGSVGNCTQCVPGTYGDGTTGATTALDACVSCAPGEFSDEYAATECVPCAPGSFSPNTSSTACAACAIGYYSSASRATACDACPLGRFSNVSSTAVVECSACPDGTYANATGSTICLGCEPGFHVVNASQGCVHIDFCTASPCLNGGTCVNGVTNYTCVCVGTGYTGDACQVDIDECDGDGFSGCDAVNGVCTNLPGTHVCSCRPGMSLETDAYSMNLCVPDSGAIIACPSGIDAEFCQVCGNTLDGDGTTLLLVSLAGGDCSASVHATPYCNADTAGLDIVADNATSYVYAIGCTQQRRDLFCSGNGDIPGGPAFYNAMPNDGICLCDVAESGGDGYIGNTSPTSQCIDSIRFGYCAGHGGPDHPYLSNATSADVQCACDASYDPWTNCSTLLPCLIDNGGCSTAPLVNCTNIGGGRTSCGPCPIGFVRGTEHENCTACSPGSYAPTVGTGACIGCWAGSYTNTSGATTCTACGAGTFAPFVGLTTCSPCEAGTYQPSTQGRSQCISCAQGYATNLMGQTACTSCEPGYYASSTGSTACSACSPGWFASGNATAFCMPCATGTFSDVPATTVCSRCAIGTVSTSQNATACSACAAGTVPDDSATQCMACPSGQYQPADGQAACLSCGLGMFASEPGTTSCSLCEPGTFSNTTGVAECTPCAFGSFANRTGATQCSTCERDGFLPISPTSGVCVSAYPCDDTPNGGCDPLTTCTPTGDGDGRVVCGSCPDGYTGTGNTSCIDIDECADGENGGCDPLVSCTNEPGTRVCGDCPEGYTGDGEVGCVDIDECGLDGICDPLASCLNLPGSYECGSCPEGYNGTGATICTDIDECDDGNNGGCDPLVACINLPGSRECGSCPEGYNGTGATSCTDIDECDDDDNSNGGCGELVCVNLPGSFECNTIPTPCDDNPCANGGSCVVVNDTVSGGGGIDFICTCRIGWSGRTCTTSVPSPCLNAPCSHGATCRQTLDAPGFECICKEQWGGPLCTRSVRCASPSPCRNGGVCIPSDDDERGGFACLCATGFVGQTCSQCASGYFGYPNCRACSRVDTCSGHGECDGASGRCACDSGYTGANCSINVNDCASRPCGDRGSCIDGIASFTCKCQAPWIGPTCGDRDTAQVCAHFGACINGGSCVVSTTMGAKPAALQSWTGAACTCPADTSGSHCHTRSDDCTWLSCANFAQCIDRDGMRNGRFVCRSPPTIVGTAAARQAMLATDISASSWRWTPWPPVSRDCAFGSLFGAGLTPSVVRSACGLTDNRGYPSSTAAGITLAWRTRLMIDALDSLGAATFANNATVMLMNGPRALCGGLVSVSRGSVGAQTFTATSPLESFAPCQWLVRLVSGGSDYIRAQLYAQSTARIAFVAAGASTDVLQVTPYQPFAWTMVASSGSGGRLFAVAETTAPQRVSVSGLAAGVNRFVTVDATTNRVSMQGPPSSTSTSRPPPSVDQVDTLFANRVHLWSFVPAARIREYLACVGRSSDAVWATGGCM